LAAGSNNLLENGFVGLVPQGGIYRQLYALPVLNETLEKPPNCGHGVQYIIMYRLRPARDTPKPAVKLKERISKRFNELLPIPTREWTVFVLTGCEFCNCP
jgi:hypothetical protein